MLSRSSHWFSNLESLVESWFKLETELSTRLVAKYDKIAATKTKRGCPLPPVALVDGQPHGLVDRCKVPD